MAEGVATSPRIDEAVIAIPATILSDGEVIDSVIHCGDDVQLNMPTEPYTEPDAQGFQLWLQVGQSVWLSKSCQGVVLPQREGDTAVRRFRLAEISQPA